MRLVCLFFLLWFSQARLAKTHKRPYFLKCPLDHLLPESSCVASELRGYLAQARRKRILCNPVPSGEVPPSCIHWRVLHLLGQHKSFPWHKACQSVPVSVTCSNPQSRSHHASHMLAVHPSTPSRRQILLLGQGSVLSPLPWLPIQVPTLCHEALHERPEVPGSGHGLSWTTGSCEEGSFPAKCSHREAVAGAFLRVPASRVTAEAAKNTSDGHGHQEQHSHHPHHCRFHGHRTTDSLPLSNRGARSV